MTRPTPTMQNAFEASKEGYSFARYGADAWMANIRWLVKQGLDADQAAFLMNSKLTRWAADFAGDRFLDRALVNYFCNARNGTLAQACDRFGAGRYGIEARKAKSPTDQAIAEIARKHLFIETLETRNSDGLDFHDLSVASIKAALEAAFTLGKSGAAK